MRRSPLNKKEKKKERRIYNLPKIDRLKTKKEKYDNIKIKKIRLIKLNKEKFEEYKTKMRKHINTSLSTINETAKINKRLKLFFPNVSSISNNSTKNLNILDNNDLTLSPSNLSLKDLNTNITNNIPKKLRKNNSNLTPVFIEN